jgi:hypothetical protein
VSPNASRELCWVGDLDAESTTLGLPLLTGVETATLYHATPEHGTYSHHGYITYARGVLVAAWSNHACDEDAPGQRVLWSRSSDRGEQWAPWEELFPPQDRVKSGDEQDWRNDRLLIANGFAAVDNALYAVAEVHVLQDRRGPGRIARAVRPDGTVGPIFWLVDDPPDPVPGFPAYPAATDAAVRGTAAKINAYLARPEHWPSWEFRHHRSRPRAADGHQLCEPTQAWPLADGTWVRLYRDLGEPRSGCNYVQFSEDDGESWTVPVQTNFPDACSRSAAGRLPDGTAYVINNPGPHRDPLVLSLSADGLVFERHAVIAAHAPARRYEGRWKDLGFAYPRATVAGDALFVIYSVCKEDMQVARVPRANLASVQKSPAATAVAAG